MTDPTDRTLLSHPPGKDDVDEAYCSACSKSFPLGTKVCPNDGARLVPLKATKDALLGRVFDGRYELRASLGQGGMGTVYRAHQLSVDREVAIKVIHPKLTNDRTTVKRFLREARLASRLNQPNIVNVYDFGQTDDGILYLVMELVRGHTLARELDVRRAMPVRRVATIALQICDALEVAHAQGIVHRDLKPGNILILDDPPGRDLIKVLDFGLAKSLVADSTSLTTNSDAILGTPLYMPPEQVQGKASDQRADLYALGCILHHMLAGVPPFVRENVQLVLAAHVNEPPPPLPKSVPGKLASALAHLMAKEPADRPASVAELRKVIERADDLDGEATDDTVPMTAIQDAPAAFAMTAPSRPEASSAASVAPARRSRIPLVMAVLVLCAFGGVIYMMTRDRSNHAAVPVSDAARAVAPSDAAVPAVAPSDAALPAVAPIDAAAAVGAPLDAPSRTRRHRDAAIVVAPAVDAASSPVDAAPPPKPDAGLPTIDFLRDR